MKKKIARVLVANRGEIAVRVIRACREVGIEAVAVYSEADAAARHVLAADAALPIGPAPATESYLVREKIIAAARTAGADAIHPGFGFLSENADFAEAVMAAGLIWIGPQPDVIRVMGSKTAARERMIAANVPVVPGFQATGDEPRELFAAEAEKLGYPVLVKASAGGGGKGMRAVERPEALAEALEGARHEAQSAFGDPTVYLEKLLARPRHIEFQIFGDSYGNVVHLYERECSIQRRHQKIVEETPSVAVTDELRARMGAAAFQAAKAVDYQGAGTVEFMLDEEGSFYFLEMNTRIQVEHPITELTTGVDLVEWQMLVAGGEPLPLGQDEIPRHGHAIECRIYAEDPARDFMPATGRIVLAEEPGGPGVRVDSGVGSGDEISAYYDPMIAKLVVYGMDRDHAIRRMSRALADYVLLGVTTNLAFLQDVLAHSAFHEGDTTTDFIDKHLSEWGTTKALVQDSLDARLAIVAAALHHRGHSPAEKGTVAEAGRQVDLHSPWRSGDGWGR